MGLDVGTTAIKGVVLEPGRGIVVAAQAAQELLSPHPGWAEMQPRAWWDGAVAVLRELLSSPLCPAGEVAGIGIAGMVPALVLLDESGRPVRNSIQQNDARTAPQIERLRGLLDQEEFFRLTGGSLNQQSLAPKMLWLSEHEPAAVDRTRWLMGSYDYLNHRLTGAISVESNWALESGFASLAAMDWHEPFVRAAGLRPEQLPPVRRPDEIVGEVTSEAARTTGLSRGTPVVAGCVDHVASAFAAGLIEDGDLNIKFGGAGDILYCIDGLDTDPRLFIDYHLAPGKFLLNGCMAASGSLVKWFAREIAGLGRGTAAPDYAALDEQAAGLEPGPDSLVVLPYFIGEKTPLHDPLARGVVFGLSLHHRPAHLHRAIMEAVAFGFRHHLDVLRERGHQPRRVVATDGGARSPLWRQISADVLGLPVEYQADQPGSAVGAAFAAGIGTGVLTAWESIRDCVRIAGRAEPRSGPAARYDQLYPIYRELYPLLQPLYRRLAELGFQAELTQRGK